MILKVFSNLNDEFSFQKQYAPGVTSLRNAALNGVLTCVTKVLLWYLLVRIMLLGSIVILQPPPTFSMVVLASLIDGRHFSV